MSEVIKNSVFYEKVKSYNFSVDERINLELCASLITFIHAAKADGVIKVSELNYALVYLLKKYHFEVASIKTLIVESIKLSSIPGFSEIVKEGLRYLKGVLGTTDKGKLFDAVLLLTIEDKTLDSSEKELVLFIGRELGYDLAFINSKLLSANLELIKRTSDNELSVESFKIEK